MDKNVKAMGQIIAKCWQDEEFKERFQTNPKDVLKEYGIQTKDDIKYTVIQSAKDEVIIVIPPQVEELNDEELDSVAGGSEYKSPVREPNISELYTRKWA